MLRFYREFVWQILEFLVYLKEVAAGAGISVERKHVRAVLSNIAHYPINDQQLALAKVLPPILKVEDAWGGRRMDIETLDGMIDKLIKIVPTPQKNTDQDLLDTIIFMLQLPYFGSRLSLKTVKALRDAILIPEELAKLKNELAKNELRCNSCEHIFASGEAMIFTRNTDGVSVTCLNCGTPSLRACPNCETGVTEIPAKTAQSLRKTGFCVACRQAEENKKNGVVAQTPAPGVHAGDMIINDEVNAATIGQRIRTTGPTMMGQVPPPLNFRAWTAAAAQANTAHTAPNLRPLLNIDEDIATLRRIGAEAAAAHNDMNTRAMDEQTGFRWIMQDPMRDGPTTTNDGGPDETF